MSEEEYNKLLELMEREIMEEQLEEGTSLVNFDT